MLAGSGRGSPQRLALVGLAVSAACLAVTTLLVLNAEPAASVAVTWLAGSTYAQSWSELQLLAIPALVLLPLAALAVRRLDVLMLDDELGTTLGLRVGPARAALLTVGAALAAAAVAVTGAIAFVGLLAPHAARLIAGGNHRRLLPVAMLVGRRPAGDRRRARADPLPADGDPLGPRRRDDRRALPQLDDVARAAGGGVTARAARGAVERDAQRRAADGIGDHLGAQVEHVGDERRVDDLAPAGRPRRRTPSRIATSTWA